LFCANKAHIFFFGLIVGQGLVDDNSNKTSAPQKKEQHYEGESI
jgi:hypothetical protein